MTPGPARRWRLQLSSAGCPARRLQARVEQPSLQEQADLPLSSTNPTEPRRERSEQAASSPRSLSLVSLPSDHPHPRFLQLTCSPGMRSPLMKYLVLLEERAADVPMP